MRDRREFSAIAAMIVMALALEPHPALADMLSSLRENTLGCGMDFFYFSRDGSVLWSDGEAISKTSRRARRS